jgi:regulator of replication initiation timing
MMGKFDDVINDGANATFDGVMAEAASTLGSMVRQLREENATLTAEVERLREGLTTILNKAEAGRTTLPGMVDMVVKVLHPVEGGQG